MKLGGMRAAVAAMALGAAGLAVAGSPEEMPREGMPHGEMRREMHERQGAVLEVKDADVRRVLDTWEGTPKEAATAMLQKYGTPDGLTDRMLVWYDTGPFTRTIVYREPVEHRFPTPHEDVLEQTIEFQVPPEKFDELAAYDGSVIVDRTAARLSARCDKEAANILALNLAHDIIGGERTVEQARLEYARNIARLQRGESPELTQRLMFDVPQRDLTVPDESIMDRVQATRVN